MLVGMDWRGSGWFGSSAVADEPPPAQRSERNDRLPERCGEVPGMSRSSCNTFVAPISRPTTLDWKNCWRLLGKAASVGAPMCCLWRTCGASELTPRWHDKRGTLVATAVCHKKHENEIDGCEAWTENNRQPLANDRFSTCRTGCAWHVLARRSKRSPEPKSAQSTRRPWVIRRREASARASTMRRDAT